MSQVNEETGNHRPVVLGLLSSVSSTRVPENVSSTLSYRFNSDNEENPNNVNNDDQKLILIRPNKKAPATTSAFEAGTSTSSHHNHRTLIMIN